MATLQFFTLISAVKLKETKEMKCESTMYSVHQLIFTSTLYEGKKEIFKDARIFF